MAGPRKAANYLNNENLIAEIIKSKKRLKESNVELTPAEALTTNLVVMLKKLVDRFAQSWNWRGYSYNDDMKSEALLALCQNAFKFNEVLYKNPFGYYTQIAKNSFLSFRDKEIRIRDIRDDLLINQGAEPSMHRQMEDERLAAIPSQTQKEQKKTDKELETLTEQLEKLAELFTVLNKLSAPDAEIDKQIAHIFGRKLLPEGYTQSVEHDQEVGGMKGTLVSVRTADGSSSSKRFLTVPYARHKVPIAITMLCLVMHKDKMTKRVNEIKGLNQANSMRIIVTERGGDNDDSSKHYALDAEGEIRGYNAARPAKARFTQFSRKKRGT